MYILHVDTCASPHTGKVELGTPNRTPQNHDLPIWWVADSSSSWSREGLTLWSLYHTVWFIRYKQIYCHYTSNFYHIIGKNYSFLFSTTTKFTFSLYKSYKISHFPHLYHIQILQKHQITPFSHYVKKSLFLTFFHISIILADLSFSPFSSIYKKSPFFTFFMILPKTTIFTKIPVFLEMLKIPKFANFAVFLKMANFGVLLKIGKNAKMPKIPQKYQNTQKWGF